MGHYSFYLEEENGKGYDFGHNPMNELNAIHISGLNDNWNIKTLCDQRASDTISTLEDIAAMLARYGRGEDMKESSRLASELADFAKQHPNARWHVV